MANIEPDSQSVIAPGTPSRPTPSHFASFFIWDEALKRERGEYRFDAFEIKLLLLRSLGDYASDHFRWERLVETIRRQCGLWFPDDKNSAVGTSRIWRNSTELLGEFQIDANWTAIRLKATTVKDLPNQSTDPTLASGTPGAGHQPRHP
jgi:hypothetical protein